MITDEVTKFLTLYDIRHCSIAAAVSGGRDSMTLLYILNALKAAFDITLNVVYVNHHIRDDSDEEEAFVTKTVAAMPDVALYQHSVDKSVWQNKSNTEERARRIRYDFFNKVCAEHNIDFIATAHHFDDKTESFFINLLRGSDIDALSPIKPLHHNIIRPFLNVRRVEINAFAAQNHIAYIDDKTNDTDLYLRNRIRHHLIPALHEVCPHYDKSLSHVFDFMAQAAEALDVFADRALAELLYADASSVVLDRRVFLSYPTSLRRNVLKRLIYRLKCTEALGYHTLCLLSGDGRIDYTCANLYAVSKSGKLFLSNTDMPPTLPAVTLTKTKTSLVNLQTDFVIASSVKNVFSRRVRSLDALVLTDKPKSVTKILSDWGIPAQLHHHAAVIVGKSGEIIGVTAFGMHRTGRMFYADGEDCILVVLT